MGLQKCQKAYSKIEKNYGVICVKSSTKIKIIIITLCSNDTGYILKIVAYTKFHFKHFR